MENAGRGIFELICRHFAAPSSWDPATTVVTVLS
jgi:hypothetical protein